MSLLDRINNATMDYSHAPVPDMARKAGWRIFGVWFVSLVNIPFLIMGVSFGRQMNFNDALTAIVIGEITLALLLATAAYIGGKSNLPSGMLRRVTFGGYGGLMVNIVVAFTLMGWYGVQTEVFGQSARVLLLDLFDMDIPLWMCILLGGALMSTTAIIGFKAIDVFSQLAMPVLLVMVALPAVWIWIDLDPAVIAARATTLPVFTAISMVIGGSISAALVAPDLTRYAKNGKSAIHATWTCVLFASVGIFVSAMVLTYASDGSDFIGIMNDLGYGPMMLALLIVATWTTNDTNAYVSSLSLSAIFRKTKKWILAACVGAFGTLFAMIGILDNLTPWLSFLGILIAPATAVFIVDYFRTPGLYMRAHLSEVPAYRFRTLLPWAAGTVLGFITTPVSSYGFGLLTVTTVPAIDGFILATIFYAGFAAGQNYCERLK